MSERKWLDGYAGQTTDELIALADEYRVDSVILAFEEALQRKAGDSGEARLSEAECVVLAIEALEREVNNGGYDQFFVNSSCEYAPIIVDALQRIGCVEIAKLTQKAIDSLGIAGPVTAEAIEDVLEEDDEARDACLNECDETYYQVAALDGPLLEFIKRHRSTIIVPADS